MSLCSVTCGGGKWPIILSILFTVELKWRQGTEKYWKFKCRTLPCTDRATILTGKPSGLRWIDSLIFWDFLLILSLSPSWCRKHSIRTWALRCYFVNAIVKSLTVFIIAVSLDRVLFVPDFTFFHVSITLFYRWARYLHINDDFGGVDGVNANAVQLTRFRKSLSATTTTTTKKIFNTFITAIRLICINFHSAKASLARSKSTGKQ